MSSRTQSKGVLKIRGVRRGSISTKHQRQHQPGLMPWKVEALADAGDPTVKGKKKPSKR
ncbi:MAG: hypothetical protein HYX97_03630 [Chloroflexi bacterium]|nr:hypothetical protein [Chloroflexota bacterium]